MTRRTDWAEYVHPAASEGKRRGGAGGTAGDSDRAYDDTDGPYGLGAWGAEAGYGDPEGDGRLDDGPRRDDGPRDGDTTPSGGSRRSSGRRGDDGWPYGGDGPQGTGERGAGAPRGGGRGGRGRGRRRGFGESSADGDPQDGGPSSSSRAEKGEPPGDPAERARGICLRLLTGTPRTRKQLADALRKREIPDDVADEVLSRFEEVGLINDSAFADAWVESRHHGRGLARRALARELRTKGVDSALIDEAVGQLDSEQEETTARELVARRLRSTRGLDRDKRIRRLASMLARKGYSEGMALRVVRQALEEEGEDTEFLDDGEGF
ncbi:recombination regulator RecX [Streptomyces phaeochromogenes]|uniref:recombination regulator RecX n=1 Tax=Streptomyces phaeochromogenes TaxID=1923 RepID=UPI00224F0D58|nr:recombination regulator RecX [Streptomyces phaeochromogenes]MCX5600964.1 recombination regulator RecX [Streptomyces phaeochromogenes]WRZ28986.1 recombination regulator RecX [Streptomyces phaeochromogenes]WSJ08467.1 recombination regulator RecX [Streptomyces phaeochromogenes]